MSKGNILVVDDNKNVLVALEMLLSQEFEKVKELRQKERELKASMNRYDKELIGSSVPMTTVLRTVEKVASTDTNVLITGENGTGKELIARRLHRLSGRSQELMVSVDMGAVSETLFESELFGHVKGAFTDARENRTGKFELADKGTLFLDEIANLPLSLQPRLLTALQNRVITRVGSNHAVPLDIRLVCATNRNPDEMVAQGLFREDLLYRINTIRINVPPLRARKGDIPVLADYFRKKYSEKYGKKSIEITGRAMERMLQHSWPGNVRELEHTIEKAVILNETGKIYPKDIVSATHAGHAPEQDGSLKKILGLEQFTHLRQLEKIDGKLAGAVRNPKQHDEKLITFKGKKGLITLMIKASAFKSKDQNLTLISMQDIKKELDEKELDSWLKLIRVLTHEIMNSIAPVTSLSENLYNYYTKKEEAISVADVDEKLINMTIKGLQVIREQGQGLTRFVESYRELTRLPKSRKNMVMVSHLLENTVMLCKSYLPCKGIKISWRADDNDLQVYVDENQISQVLINLLKNSAEALHYAPDPEIRLRGRINAGGQAEILVTDNGPGISPELTEEIFIPFFTTRENGNGIGLSLSRQIMRLHGGSLKVHSIPDKETTFTMVFD